MSCFVLNAILFFFFHWTLPVSEQPPFFTSAAGGCDAVLPGDVMWLYIWR
jgi:hypothetical protein